MTDRKKGKGRAARPLIAAVSTESNCASSIHFEGAGDKQEVSLTVSKDRQPFATFAPCRGHAGAQTSTPANRNPGQRYLRIDHRVEHLKRAIASQRHDVGEVEPALEISRPGVTGPDDATWRHLFLRGVSRKRRSRESALSRAASRSAFFSSRLAAILRCMETIFRCMSLSSKRRLSASALCSWFLVDCFVFVTGSFLARVDDV